MGHMVRRVLFVLAWVVATFATGLLAWSAVHLAGSQVSEDAIRPLTAAQVEALPGPVVPSTLPNPAGSPNPSAVPTTTVPPVRATTATAIETPATAAPPSTLPPATTPPPATTLPPVTTLPPATRVTTAAPAASEVRTYHTGGGSVTIIVSPGVVTWSSATPASGYTVEVENRGPEEVKVKFEAAHEGEDYEFRARWRDGRLVVETGSDD